MGIVSYAQNFEDVMLWRALKDVKNGFYIDVGANHPVSDSVTKAFYENGWNGINIEPELELSELLKKDRPRDLNLNIAISSKVSSIEFYVSSIRGWSTTDKNSSINLKEKDSFSESRIIKALSLDKLFEENNVKEVHFLKIDVEGAERDVLESISFDRVRPWICVIEATKPTTQIDISYEWEDILFKHNYIFAYFDGLNKYYVAKEYEILVNKLRTPPNVFDKFILANDRDAILKMDQAEQKVIEAEEKVIEAEQKVIEAEQKVIEAEQKVIEAEEKAKHLEMMVLNSLSWKITKPLRFIKGLPRKILRRLNEKILKRIYDVNKEIIDANIIKPENKRKKLLIDCSFIYTSGLNTGIQRVVRNIVNNIEPYAIENNLDLVTVALVDGFIVKVDINRKKFTTNSRLLGLLYRIKQKIQLYWSLQKDIETVYSEDILLMLDSTWHLNIWPSVEYAKKRHVKIIGVTYDLIPISHPQFCDESLVKLFTNWYEKSIDYFDGYIAISKTVMLDLKSYLEKKDININKYSFDYFKLGSDFSDMKYYDINIDEKIKKIYQNNKSIYLTVSTIEPRKNHRYLFETFKKLWTAGIDVTLVIVGKEGWKTKDLLLEMRSHLEYGKKLLIFNHLNDNELQYCYKNSKALLFPSFIEGYGLPIIESLQNGLNVLASDTPIHKEVGGENIDYFDINDSSSLHTIIEKIENKNLILKSLNEMDIIIPKWKDSAKELCLIANSTSNYKAFNTSSSEKELLVDITHIYTEDLKTGIQRVVRSILNELKIQSSLKVRTIFLTNEDGFPCYKYIDTQKIVVPKKDDTFLGLDLNARIIEADNAGLFTDWKSRGTSITFVVYDILPILNSHWWPEGVNNGHESWLKVLLKYSDKIFCISQSVKNDVQLYIEDNNIKVNDNLIVSWFHLGADIANSNPSLGMPIESENVLSKISDKISFLIVGTLEPRKGHFQTLEAFNLLWKDNIDVNLIIVGKEGWMVKKLINKIKNHPYLDLKLFWLDGISDEYLDKLYNKSTCLLASSEGEGFGLPLIEAAQYKKPIIARDILVFKEVASTFAYYFKDDNNPEIIAKTINEWLELYEKDNHPKSDDMNWLSWKESTKELQNLIIGKNR